MATFDEFTERVANKDKRVSGGFRRQDGTFGVQLERTKTPGSVLQNAVKNNQNIGQVIEILRSTGQAPPLVPMNEQIKLDEPQISRGLFDITSRSVMNEARKEFESLPDKEQRQRLKDAANAVLDQIGRSGDELEGLSLTERVALGRKGHGPAEEKEGDAALRAELEEMLRQLEGQEAFGLVEAYHRWFDKPVGAIISALEQEILYRGVPATAKKRMAKDGEGFTSTIDALMDAVKAANTEEGLDFVGAVDAFTDALDLRSGQQGLNEILAGIFVDPIFPAGPLGAAQTRLALSAMRKFGISARFAGQVGARSSVYATDALETVAKRTTQITKDILADETGAIGRQVVKGERAAQNQTVKTISDQLTSFQQRAAGLEIADDVIPEGFISTTVQEAIRRGEVMVGINPKGAFGRLIDHIPGFGPALSNFLTGRRTLDPRVHASYVGARGLQASLGTQLWANAEILLKQADDVFGKGAIHGTPIEVGDVLTPIQRRVVEAFRLRDIALTRYMREVLGIDYKPFKITPNPTGAGVKTLRQILEEEGVFLPIIGKTQKFGDVIADMASPARLAGGRGKRRVFETVGERQVADEAFEPFENVAMLLHATDESKVQRLFSHVMTVGNNGKTRTELAEQLVPDLVKQKNLLQKTVRSLQGKISRAGQVTTRDEQRLASLAREAAATADSIDNVGALFGGGLDNLKTGVERLEGRLSILTREANKLSRKVQRQFDIPSLQRQLNTAKKQLENVKNAYEGVNFESRGWKLVPGTYRYFPTEVADDIARIVSKADHNLLKWIDEIRASILNGDLSPITGVQMPMQLMFRAFGTNPARLGKEIIDSFKDFSPYHLALDIATNRQSWDDYAFYALRRSSAGMTPEEFRTGILGKILGPKLGKGLGKLNDRMFSVVNAMNKRLFDEGVEMFRRQGFSMIEAKAAAGQLSNVINPAQAGALRGLTEFDSMLERLPFTSMSFFRRPIEMVNETVAGLTNMIMRKPMTAKQMIYTKMMLQFTAFTWSTGIISNALTAHYRGDDVGKAIRDAANPANGRSFSLNIGERSVPIGGPFRGIIKALAPRPVMVDGHEILLPFAGIGNYVWNRANPAVKPVLEVSLTNEDFFGNKIRRGSAMEAVGRGAAHLLLGVAPLSIREFPSSLLRGESFSDALWNTATQFAGFNEFEETPFQARDLRVRQWAAKNQLAVNRFDNDRKAINGYSDLDADEQRMFKQEFPDVIAAIEEEIAKRAERGVGEYVWMDDSIQAMKQATERQESDDFDLLSFLRNEGGISQPTWRDRFNERQDKLQAERTTLYNLGPERPKKDRPLDRYFAFIDEQQEESNGIMTEEAWDRVDAWVASQPKAIRDNIIKQIKFVGLTDVSQLYYDSISALSDRKINDTAWFDIFDKYAPSGTEIGRLYREWVGQTNTTFRADWERANPGVASRLERIQKNIERDRERIRRADPVVDAIRGLWFSGDFKNGWLRNKARRNGAEWVFNWLMEELGVSDGDE